MVDLHWGREASRDGLSLGVMGVMAWMVSMGRTRETEVPTASEMSWGIFRMAPIRIPSSSFVPEEYHYSSIV